MMVRNLTVPGLASFCETDELVLHVEEGGIETETDLRCTFSGAPWSDTFVAFSLGAIAADGSGEAQGSVSVTAPTWSAMDRWEGYFGTGELSGDFLTTFENDGYNYELKGRIFVKR